MTTYYKATRPDGTDFYSGKVDYAGALASGERVQPRDSLGSYPPKKLCGPGVLHAATVPAESLLGGSWPCRLFAVEGRPLVLNRSLLNYDSTYPHTRGFTSLRVIEELPAWQVLGPNGQEVAALIERVRQVPLSEVFAAAWDLAQRKDWIRAQDARGKDWVRARDAALLAAWSNARVAAWDAAWIAARAGSGAASVAALVVRDLITDEQYQTLAGPWLSVMGEGVVT